MVKVLSLEKRLNQNKSQLNSRHVVYNFPLNQRYALDFISLYEGHPNWVEFASENVEYLMNSVTGLIKEDKFGDFIGKDILYPWSDKVCDLCEDNVEVIDSSNIIFPYFEKELHLKPCETIETLFDHIIRSFILYHRKGDSSDFVSFTPLREVQKRAMKHDQQNLLEVLQYMPRISKFSCDKVKFE